MNIVKECIGLGDLVVQAEGRDLQTEILAESVTAQAIEIIKEVLNSSSEEQEKIKEQIKQWEQTVEKQK